MKKGFVFYVVLIGCIVFTGSMAGAMDGTMSGGCCGSSEMNMACSSMSSCNHDACTCKTSSTDESDPAGHSCSCCAMCADGGCSMNMLTAIMDINPGNLNVKSQGNLITVYIELNDPENPLLVYSIDPQSIFLKKVGDAMILIDGEKLFTTGFCEYGDYDENGIADLMVKFDRQDLIGFLTANKFNDGEVSISVSGKLYDGVKFKGTQTINISGN